MIFRGLDRPSSPACPKASISCPESLISESNLRLTLIFLFFAYSQTPESGITPILKSPEKLRFLVFSAIALAIRPLLFKTDACFERSFIYLFHVLFLHEIDSLSAPSTAQRHVSPFTSSPPVNHTFSKHYSIVKDQFRADCSALAFGLSPKTFYSKMHPLFASVEHLMSFF